MKTEKPQPPATITAEQLANLAGLTKRRLYQLAEEKKIPPADNGRFPMVEAIRQLFLFFQRDGEQLSREKLLRATAERQQAQRKERLATKQEAEDWLAAEDHYAIVSALVTRLEALPGKMQSEQGLAPAQIAGLQRALDSIRTEAAEAVENL